MDRNTSEVVRAYSATKYADQTRWGVGWSRAWCPCRTKLVGSRCRCSWSKRHLLRLRWV